MRSEGRTDRLDEARGATQCRSPSDPAGLQPMVRIGVTGHRDLVDREQADAAASPSAAC